MKIKDIIIGERHRKDLGDIKSLVKSIEEVGLLHPVVVRPDGKLIAGERRLKAFEIMGREDIPVNVVDLDEIIKGEFDENTVRKDFTPSEAVAIQWAVSPLEKAEAKKRQAIQGSINLGVTKPADSADLGKGETRDKVARRVGMSHDKLKKAETVVVAAEKDPEKYGDLVEQMDKTGKVEPAYRKMRMLENKERSQNVVLPEGLYDVILADPPWKYDFAETENRSIANHYQSLPVNDICDYRDSKGVRVQDKFAADAILFLWATQPKLKEALLVMEAWGFEYKTGAVWVKDKIGMGYYFREQHELLLVGKKGKILVPEPSDRVSSVITAPRRGHSEKPVEFYSIIEKMYQRDKYLELFARTKRDKWVSFGDEVTREG